MTCKDCIHYEACGGFTPTDLDQDVFDYCRKGIADEIPNIEERCSCFMDKADVVEVVRCKDCKHFRVWETGSPTCEHWTYVDDVSTDPDAFCSYGERREE